MGGRRGRGWRDGGGIGLRDRGRTWGPSIRRNCLSSMHLKSSWYAYSHDDAIKMPRNRSLLTPIKNPIDKSNVLELVPVQWNEPVTIL